MDPWFNDSVEFNVSTWNWNDTGTNTSDYSYDYDNSSFLPSPLLTVIIYTFYSTIFVLALVGNTVVCAVVFTSIRKWTVCNYFIVNMAAGDILMSFFCIPFTFVPTLVLLYWPFGSVMCRVMSFSQAVSVFVSAYSMMAISSDRYLAILYPLRPRMTRKQAKLIICIIWLLAMLTALPILLLSELSIPKVPWYQRNEYYVCSENWGDNNHYEKSLYDTALFLLQYCFPLLVLLFTYGRIGIEIWGKRTPGEAHRNRDLRFARSKRKMIKMMIVVVVVFAICWLPLNLFIMVSEKYPNIWNYQKINIIYFAFHWLAMSHSAYNPIIYSCFNSKFRQGFVSLAHRCGCRCCGHSWSQSGADLRHLHRANTFTTYTCTGISARSTKGSPSCRVLLPVHHTGSVRFNNQQPLHHHPLLHVQNSQHLQQQPQQQQQLISENDLCRHSPLLGRHSSSTAVAAAAVNGHPRSQKFVFRANHAAASFPSTLVKNCAESHI